MSPKESKIKNKKESPRLKKAEEGEIALEKEEALILEKAKAVAKNAYQMSIDRVENLIRAGASEEEIKKAKEAGNSFVSSVMDLGYQIFGSNFNKAGNSLTQDQKLNNVGNPKININVNAGGSADSGPVRAAAKTEPKTGPEHPAEPKAPASPPAPVEPKEPPLPEKPKAPEKPAEPEAPEKLKEPVEPEKPAEPEAPKEPAEPEKPETKETVSIDYFKAAELLLGEDFSGLDEKKKAKILPEIKKKLHDPELGFSNRALEQAMSVISINDKMAAVYKEAVLESKRTGKPVKDVLAEVQRKDKRAADFLSLENFYAQELKALKQIILEDKNEFFKKKFGEGDPRVLEKMKAQEYPLVVMMARNIRKVQEIKANYLRAESFRDAGILKKALLAYAKLPRPLRAIIGAGLIGGATAVFAPSLVLGSVPTYLGYRMIRSGFGATFGAGLQKIFGNKIVDKLYGRDVKKKYKGFKEELESGEVELKEEPKGFWRKLRELMDKELLGPKPPKDKISFNLDELIVTEKFGQLAETNYQLAQQLAVRLSRADAKKRWTYLATAIGTGVIGGFAGAQVADWLYGHGYLAGIIGGEKGGGGTSGGPEQPGPGGTGEGPDSVIQKAVVGKGEGVTHALKRQILDDPNKWGYKGSLDDQAALDKWATIKARDIAIQNHYIDPKTGLEVRVKDIGPVGAEGNPAYYLDPTGRVYELTPNAQGSYQVVGGGVGTVNPYEYQFKPQVGDQAVPSVKAPGEIPTREVYSGLDTAPVPVSSVDHQSLIDQLTQAAKTKKFLFFGGPDAAQVHTNLTSLVQTEGLSGHRADLFVDYLTQGKKVSGDVLKRFLDDSGQWNSEAFRKTISAFKEAVKSHALPDSSVWQPRSFVIGGNEVWGLIRKAGKNSFDYVLEDGSKGSNVPVSIVGRMLPGDK